MCDSEDLLSTTLKRIEVAANLYSSQQIMTKKILRDQVVNLNLENFNNDTELILDSWFSVSGHKRLEFLYNKLNK